MRLNNRGFSLLELIVSMAILAVLSGLLAPQLFRYVEKSKEARDLQTLDTVYMAVQAALMDEDAYESMAEGAQEAYDRSFCLKKIDGKDAFGQELEALLGELDRIRLISGNAGKGEVCIRIRCETGKERDLKISVYSGSSSDPGKRVGSLEVVGASFAE